MAATLTDEELRKKLKILGEDVGPITPTTRRAYQRKLDNLTKHRSSRRNVLNALSSDDSEIDQGSPSESTRRRKRYNHRIQTPVPSLNKLPLTPTEKNKQSPAQQRDLFKKPFSKSPVANRNPAVRQSPNRSSGNSSFEMETSDSDVDAETLLHTIRTLRARNHSVLETPKQTLQNIFPKPFKSVQANTPNGDDFHSSVSSSNRYTDSKIEDYRKNFLYRGYNSISNERKHTKDSLNGYVSDALNGEFQNEKSRGRTTNYSHCVSWMLVIAVAGLFIILGLFYMSAVQKTQLGAGRTHLESFICKSNKDIGCIPLQYFKIVRALSRDLYNLLSTVAGEFECQTGRESRNLTLTETKVQLEELSKNHEEEEDVLLPFDKVFEYTILLTLRNPEWGIRAFSSSGEPVSNLHLGAIQKVSALESTQASKSLWCRLKHSIHWTLTKLLLMVLVAAFVGLSYFSIKFYRKRKEQQEKKFFDLVDEVIDTLQNSDVNERAVIHIRDMLIPLKERREKYRLWEKVVAFIEENESRVQVITKEISGEDFKVWRWLPSPSADLESGKHGKVWQGQAFTSLSKGKNHAQYSPTPCLKIRNMFDTEVEYGDDWQIYIQDAILEKCEGNDGVIHVAVDNSSTEGCVYVMCDSPRNAGKAFSALHGWWFDGKLVTVKFLRLQRYLERYPEAQSCTRPLKPSNNKRLSLSAPFFSSALERS